MTQLLNRTTDQRIVLQGTWEQFKLIQKGAEGSPGVRLSFCDGEIEILMPGREHEFFSRIIGYLVMTFCFERGICCLPTGSMTQEKEGVSSVQADESYCIGSPKPSPDLSVEVVFTSGGEAKLAREHPSFSPSSPSPFSHEGRRGARWFWSPSPSLEEGFRVRVKRLGKKAGCSQLAKYEVLGVREVWFWQDGVFALYHLRTDGYERIQRSQLEGLKDLDVSLLSRCVLIAETNELEAIAEFRQAI